MPSDGHRTRLRPRTKGYRTNVGLRMYVLPVWCTHCLRVAQRPKSIVVLLSRRIPQPQVNGLPVDHYIGAGKNEGKTTKIKSKHENKTKAKTSKKPSHQRHRQTGRQAGRQADRQTNSTDKQTTKRGKGIERTINWFSDVRHMALYTGYIIRLDLSVPD